MTNAIIITIVAMRPDSGPNVPPPMTDCDVCVNFTIDEVSIPLTLNPKRKP